MLFRRKSAKVAAATVERTPPTLEPRAQAVKPIVKPAVDADGELDVRSLGRALWRRKWAIIIPTLIVAALTAVAVEVITPKYKSSATILFEGRENIFLRPDAEKTNADRGLADDAALTSQVQLILSRELALNVINKLKLNELPEFDPVVSGIPPWKYALIMVGAARNPMRMTAEERVLEAYYERLTAFPLDRSRVITVEFESSDPKLAARVVNAVIDGYLELQQSAKQQQNTAAAQWLDGEIAKLRPRVGEAEAKAEAFRGKTNLFLGTNNTTLSSQQLGEFNSQLGIARAQKADAETRARLIRDMLRRGDPIESADVTNSDLIKRLSEQRVTLRAQLAEQSSTLLDGHPRIKELKAQIADLDKQITSEAEKLVRSLENDAKIAGARVDALSANLDQLKRQAATTNEEDVQLRALDREAKSLRDLLESYLAKYREATARETIATAPADTRIISRAAVSNTPAFPKKLPTILVATLATLVISAGFVTTSELMRHSPVGGSRPVPAEAPTAAWAPAATRPSAAPTHPEPGVAFQRARRAGARPPRGGRGRAAARGIRRRAQRRHDAERDHAGAAAGARSTRGAGRPRGRRAEHRGDLDRSAGAGHRRSRARLGLVRRCHHARQALARPSHRGRAHRRRRRRDRRLAASRHDGRGAGAHLRSRGHRRRHDVRDGGRAAASARPACRAGRDRADVGSGRAGA